MQRYSQHGPSSIYGICHQVKGFDKYADNRNEITYCHMANMQKWNQSGSEKEERFVNVRNIERVGCILIKYVMAVEPESSKISVT